MTFRTLVTVFALSAASLAMAQAPAPTGNASTPRIDQREANQQKRIDQGAASGQLTQKEADKLNKQQAGIQKQEDKAKADGVVTKKERAKLTHRQNKADRAITRNKHDRQKKNPA